MFAISFRFPAGRYHATPWGRHVNEADVAWPPEPWRLLRALVATWHRKADRDRYPESQLSDLVERLAENLPRYHLPDATHAHSRHYMPLAKGAEKTTLVFDAFVRVASDQPVVMAWTDLILSETQLLLAQHLCERLGYLGRAESWVEATASTDLTVELNCTPLGRLQGTETTERLVPVPLLAPLSIADFQQWRKEWQGDALNNLPARKRKAVQTTLGACLLDALLLETADLQAAGWSVPPGARQVVYLRPDLGPTVRTRRTPARPEPQTEPTVARFVLAGRPRPRFEDAVKIGELMRLATLAKYSWSTDLLTGRKRPCAPPIFTGKELGGKPLTNDPAHSHAFWLPQDADGDGEIDHIVVYANMGFDAEARRGLDSVTRLWFRDQRIPREEAPEARQEWRLALEGFGSVQDFAKPVTFLDPVPSRNWQSITPFLASGHLKSADGYGREVRRLLVRRGLIAPELAKEVKVEMLPSIKIHGRERRAIHFHRFRSNRSEPQPDASGALLRITLPKPICGPLALGYASHFGLGLFAPVPP